MISYSKEVTNFCKTFNVRVKWYWGAFVLPLLWWKRDSKPHAPSCHLWSVRFNNIFPHYVINCTISKKKKKEWLNIKHVFCFFCNFVWNISLYKKNRARNDKFIKEVCSKKDRTFAIKTLLLILKHFKHFPLQSSPLYWRHTFPNVSSIVEMLPGTHFL
jgi:hypothetical protein